MSAPKSVLVTGGTGLLGRGVKETIPDGCRLVSVHLRKYELEDETTRHLVLDVCDRRRVEQLFAEFDFDAVIHAAGIAGVDYVENHYEESRESNIAGTLNVASACRRAGCHLVYISTNAVFDGSAAPYRETDPVRPINRYGCLKVECENLVRETVDRFTIVRPILMYGWNHPQCRPNPVTWLLGKLGRGETVHMVNDVYENPLYNLQCGQVLWRVIERGLTGILHVAGGEAVSRYEFAAQVAAVFGLDRALIKPVESSFFPQIAPRPKNTSFVTERVRRELEIEPLSIQQGLERMKVSRERGA